MSRRRFPFIRRGVVVCAFLAAAALPAAAQRAVILVRHAEKADATKDTALSETGRARASKLAGMLAGAGVTAVYSSEYRRTRETAEPLAALLRIPIQTFRAADPAGLVARLRAAHADGVVLVVGHSDTLPKLLKLLGHETEVTIADDDFGSVFVLVPRTGASPLVIRLNF